MWREQREVTAPELGLSASQAAQALGVSVETIRHWSDLGYLESYRAASGQRRFSQDRIDGFIGRLEHQHVVDPLRDRRVG
jgi:excisionase family DNA binding protein